MLLVGERHDRVVDVARRSDGRFSADPMALLADWDAVRDWAAGLPADAADAYEALFEGVNDALANEIDEEELLGDDACEMCERVMPLTRHHLFPRTCWKFFEKRPPAGFAESGRSLQETAALCRQCHSAVHLFADERALGEHYNTVAALLQQESLAKFAAFQNKQKARKGGHVNALKYAR